MREKYGANFVILFCHRWRIARNCMKKNILFLIALFQVIVVCGQQESYTADTTRQIICSPNPFTKITQLSFDVSCDSCDVSVQLFDGSGIYVTTLFEGKSSKGKIKTQWDGKNALGEKAGNDIYTCKIISKEFETTIKLIYTE
jgi:hypothetical protein